MNTVWCASIFVALALLTAGNRRAVGLVIGGGFLYFLGLGSVLPDLDLLSHVPPTSLAVSAGFVWAGVAMAKWGVLFGVLRRTELTIAKLPFDPRPALVVLGTISLLTLIYVPREVLLAGGWRGLVAAAGLLGTGVVGFTLLGLSKAAKGWKWLDERWLTHWSSGTPALLPGRPRLKGALALTCFGIALVVPHLVVVAVALILGLFLLHDALRPSGKVPRLGLQPFIVLVALAAVTWSTWTIAGGDIPLTLAGLREAPFSEAAEMTLAPILGLAAWALLGLWPLYGTGPACALSLLGGALLIRWGMGVIPSGMEHLAPVAGVVAVLAAMHAASVRRAGEYAAALGVLAVVPSGAGAWPFFLLGSLPATLWVLDRKEVLPGLDRQQVVGILLIPALAYALPTMLRGETVLTVVAVIAGVVLFLPTSHPQVGA